MKHSHAKKGGRKETLAFEKRVKDIMNSCRSRSPAFTHSILFWALIIFPVNCGKQDLIYLSTSSYQVPKIVYLHGMRKHKNSSVMELTSIGNCLSKNYKEQRNIYI